MPEELSFREFQRFIREHYHKYDSNRGTGGTFLWLMEEVGELASALQQAAVARGEHSASTPEAGEHSASTPGAGEHSASTPGAGEHPAPAPAKVTEELPEALRANLQEEFADVLGWLSTLANMHGVDLESAVRAKYMSKPDPGPHKL